MSLAGKKVLCVGGNGYVGNYFVARLIQAQAQVQILCRLFLLLFQEWTKVQIFRKRSSWLVNWKRFQPSKISITNQQCWYHHSYCRNPFRFFHYGQVKSRRTRNLLKYEQRLISQHSKFIKIQKASILPLSSRSSTIYPQICLN